ncbi:hypothetical protein BH11BAC3_BH11BAC3_38340 [soil metagenome]
MKFVTICLLFTTNLTYGQQWQAEIMGGVSGYSGDLTQKYFSSHSIGPAVNINIKYATFNDFIVFRAGVGYGKVGANDKFNTDQSLLNRNLNFKTDILEASLCVEYNILDPKVYEGYPYVFAGVGAFHFNPYTYDKDNKKTFLQPLGTEGQGLQQYPDRKPYSTTQLCIPFGLGWKMRINAKMDVIYEFGARFLFNDYLDDVSTTYVDPDILFITKGEKSAELSYRKLRSGGIVEGSKRGNPKSKDQYYFTGFKFLINIGSNSDNY